MSALPGWIPKTAMLVGIYIATMLVLTVWMPVWHDLDVTFFQWLTASHLPSLSSEISLVDVRDWDAADIPANRRTIASFLSRVTKTKEHPKAIILDVSFGPCQTKPCDNSWTSARAALIGSLQAAAATGIAVYATEEVVVDADDSVVSSSGARDATIYEHLAGAGHTGFTIVPGSRFLFYRVCYSPSGGLDHDVWSMVSRVLPGFDATSGCDAEHRPVIVGAQLPHAAPAIYSITSRTPFPDGANFDGKYVIVGALQLDHPQYSDRSGPELVAWALNDALLRQASMISLQTYTEARPQNGMLLLLVPAFAVVTVLVFTACYFLARRLKLRGLRPFLPMISSLCALCGGLALLAAFEYWMLLSHEIQPQVTLISIGIVLVAILCGVRGGQIEFEDRSAIDAAPQEKYDYDVFISYAHDEGAWVYEHVYVPLRDARLPDGRKLSIFFDTSTIRSGTAWQDAISLSIDASRFIVPVYSEIYFQKPYCRFEIKRAQRKWIGAGEQSRCVLPIMRGHPKILQTVDDIQATSIDDEPGLVHMHIAEITARLSQGASAASPQPEPSR